MNKLNLKDRVAAVIGGTSGLGRAIALGLAEAGADVIVGGRRRELVDEVAREIEDRGRSSLRSTVDVCSRASIDLFRDSIVGRYGKVHILVNAAGKTARVPTKEVTESEWRDIMDTNLTGMLYACQSFHSILSRTGSGRIINIASLGSFVGLRDVSAYTASKAAVLALTRNLAVEWATEDINVNAIAPGVFRTDMNKDLLDNTDRGREYLIRIPMKRFGTAEELAGAAVLLASEAASYITGQCLVVDGGFLASGVNS